MYFTETHIKDHLGNTRVAFGMENNALVVKQVNSYYPFGMNIKGLTTGNDIPLTKAYPPNEYLYNGKMFQDELGLDWYDYGARFYDPALGRWHSLDPNADQEDQESESPYCYVANNPISRIDPDGRTWLDRLVATAAGTVDNMTGSNTRSLYSPTDPEEYNDQLDKTDKVDYAAGIAETVGGGTVAGGGLVAALPSGGTTLIPAAAGAVVALHGTFMSANAVKNQAKGNHYGEKKNNNSSSNNKLVEQAKEVKAKQNAAAQRKDNRQAQTTKGNSRTGNNNQGTRGSHSSTSGGNKGDKHSNGEARRAKEQKKADEKK